MGARTVQLDVRAGIAEIFYQDLDLASCLEMEEESVLLPRLPNASAARRARGEGQS